MNRKAKICRVRFRYTRTLKHFCLIVQSLYLYASSAKCLVKRKVGSRKYPIRLPIVYYVYLTSLRKLKPDIFIQFYQLRILNQNEMYYPHRLLSTRHLLIIVVPCAVNSIVVEITSATSIVGIDTWALSS